MARNLQKGPFFQKTILQVTVKDQPIPTKNSTILPEYIGKIYMVHNGQELTKLQITDAMVGFKFGEFIVTKKRHVYKKKKQTKKKK